MRCSQSFYYVCIFWLIFAATPLASASQLSLSQISEKHQTDLFAITSNKNALHVFTRKLQADLPLITKQTQHRKNPSRKMTPPDIKDAVITLMTNLLASRLAATTQTTVQQGNLPKIQQFLDQKISGYQWAQSQVLSPSMTQVFSFNKNLSNFLKALPPHLERPPHFDDFARYVDQHYPELTGSPDSWLGLLQEGNTSEIEIRLSKYWEQEQPISQQAVPTSDQQDGTNKDSYAQYYSWTRLWPIYKSHLIALTIQAKVEAEQLAQQSLNAMNNFQKNQTKKYNMSRICGTWHWTVHNHQNHGDHKMTLVLGKSSKHPTKQPQPTEVIIKGDTVYLYWKFPRGYQEDSLLLSNDDKRLEGTFMNTLGPYGSITGKRLKSCKRQ